MDCRVQRRVSQVENKCLFNEGGDGGSVVVGSRSFWPVCKTVAELARHRFVFADRVSKITIRRSHYDVQDWETCRKKFVDHILHYRFKHVEKDQKDPNWLEKSHERVRPLYPAIVAREDAAEDQKPVLKTLSLIIALCDVVGICPDDVTISCSVANIAPEKGETCSDVSPLNEFKNDIIANYPSGFDFKDTSRRLIESRLGKPVSEAMVKALREQMFERSDGLWFLPEMIMNEASLKLMTQQADELLQKEGCFALASLSGEFESAVRNIPNGLDFKKFFEEFIANKIGGKIRGHKQWRTCFRYDIPDDDGWQKIAERVHEVLLSAGDAIPINDVVAKLSHLNRDVVLRVCQENLKNVVIFAVDEIEYAKLLEAYYLPDDFAETLSSFIAETEANQGVVSIVLLEAELNVKYGDGFRVNYGLEDDAVFKLVVSKSFANDGYVWKKDMFVSNAKRQESNVAEVFAQTRDGMFHEEEFFRFALESRGMTNRGMLILTFLRMHCVRLSKEWWISRSAFEKKCNLNEMQYIEIGNALNDALGNNPYVSIASIKSGVYEALPQIEIDGRSLEWNPYLLTSLSVFKVRNAKVINDEPSPYTVTAMVVPARLENIKDIVEYVLGACPPGHFKDADAAFEHLKANNIRLTRTAKLIQKINEILKGC